MVAMTEIVAPATGWPVWIDCTKTSRLAVERALGEQAEIGDDDEARVGRVVAARRIVA